MRNHHGISAAAQRVITPDFSMYRDMSLIERQCDNYRSDAIGHSWQQNSLIAVPDVRWDAENFRGSLLRSAAVLNHRHRSARLSQNTVNREVSASALHTIIEKLPPVGTAALRFSVGREQGDARPSTERSAQSPEDAVCLGQKLGFSDGKLH
ncbi:MAG: DUF4417 domain-containing protein [Aeriscardovia sp.]|nr:DUF4417 domain-containing protein [Aeriscardovia sp.]